VSLTPRSAARRATGACALAAALLACPSPGPVVKKQTYTVPGQALREVAIMPFYARPEFVGSQTPGGVDAGTAAELVGRFMTEALASQGLAVVPANDVALAFLNAGVVAPRGDAAAAAALASREFGATSVLLGEVWRYRDRSGEALGAEIAASVAFSVTLYAAPRGEKLWTARFDETQESLMANPLRARRYPGGGMRWLSAAEFARWGADEIARSLVGRP
jgi:hypothetical protein